MAAMSREAAAWLAPLVQGALVTVAEVLPTLDPVATAASLRLMARDPTEAVIWENTGPPSGERYLAGGPLLPERIELTLGPRAAMLDVAGLRTCLRVLSEASDAQMQPGPQPWSLLVRVPGQPRALVQLLPGEREMPDTLLLRILLGGPGPAERLLDSKQVEASWREASATTLLRWIAQNRERPLDAHPVFAAHVELPGAGLPGLCVIRRPPLPYSPLLPVGTYQTPVAWAVVETPEELAACTAYHRQPGASVSAEPPLFRYRPPSSLEPARLVGGIIPDVMRVVRTPWADVGAVSIYTLSDAVLAARPALRREAHRGRYLIHVAEDPERTAALWRSLGLVVERAETTATWH